VHCTARSADRTRRGQGVEVQGIDEAEGPVASPPERSSDLWWMGGERVYLEPSPTPPSPDTVAVPARTPEPPHSAEHPGGRVAASTCSTAQATPTPDHGACPTCCSDLWVPG
jgi:hypothetical protein